MRFRSGPGVLLLTLAAWGCSSSSSKPSATTAGTRPVATTTATVEVPRGPTASLPADTIVRVAQANATVRGWAHIDLQFHMSAKTLVFSQDSGPDTGRQTVMIGTEHATVLLIDHVAYVNANAGALADYFGLAPSSASFAGKWIAIKPSDAAYTTVAAGVSLSDALKQITIDAPFGKPKPTTINGARAIGVSGTVPTTRGGSEPGTLYVPASGEILPLAFDFSDPGATDRATFSAWGKKVALTAPPNAVAFSSVLAGPG
jgi:hypothetical protein